MARAALIAVAGLALVLAIWLVLDPFEGDAPPGAPEPGAPSADPDLPALPASGGRPPPPRGATLVVTAREEGGETAEGVAVRLTRVVTAEHSLAEGGITDASGRCVFEGLTTGPTMVRAIGIPRVWRVEVPETGTVTLDIAVPPSRVVSGRVTDKATGAPIAGARVGPAHLSSAQPVESGPDGRFAFVGRVTLGVMLEVRAEGYARDQKLVPREGDLDFALERGTTVRGKVVTEEGWPVEGAEVIATAQRRGRTLEVDIRHTESDDQGRFVLAGLRADMGSHVLMIRSEGRGRLLKEIRTDAGDVGLGVLVLPSGRAIEGVALDREGEPRDGAVVLIMALGDHGAPLWPVGPERVRADDLGRFRFADLGPGTYRLMLWESNALAAQVDVELPPGEDLLGVELWVTEGRTLVFRVEDAQGRPIAGARVSAISQGRTVNGRTGREGTAVLVDVPNETVTASAHVMPADGGDAYLPATVQRVEPGIDEVCFVMRSAARVSGTVVDADGKPLARMYVMVMDPEGGQLPHGGAADEKGAFSLSVPADRPVDLVVNGSRLPQSGRGPYEITNVRGERKGVMAPGEGIVIRCAEMKPTSSLSLIVLDVDGDPMAGVIVGVASRLGSEKTVTDESGRAAFDGLPPERVIVYVSNFLRDGLPEDALTPSAQVVPEGQEVVLRFSRGVFLTGRVLLPDGKPAAKTYVALRPEGGETRKGWTDAEGRFRIAVEPGMEHSLHAYFLSDAGREFQGARIDVVAGDKDIEVKLHPR